MFSFLLLSTSSLTHAINVDVVGSATDTYSYTSPVYTVSCDGHEQSDIVDIDCMWGKCTVRRESLGYYVVRIPRSCADTVCRIIEDGGAGYKIKVDEPSECACNEWRVEKRESGKWQEDSAVTIRGGDYADIMPVIFLLAGTILK